MTAVLSYIRPRRVAFARARGDYEVAAREAWERVLGWLEVEGHRSDSIIGFGLIHDDPRMVAAGQCRYDACVDMPDNVIGRLPASIGTQLIPGGAYMLERHTGGCHDIRRAIASLCGEWAPSSSILLDRQRPFMEILHEDPLRVAQEKRRVDIGIPVVVGEATDDEGEMDADPPPLRLVVNS